MLANESLVKVDRHTWHRALPLVAGLTTGTRLLAYVLATFANKDGSSVRPGIQRLSTDAHMSERHAQRGVEQLEAHGLLGCLRRSSGVHGRANVYQLTVRPALFSELRPDDGPPTPAMLMFSVPRTRTGRPPSPTDMPRLSSIKDDADDMSVDGSVDGSADGSAERFLARARDYMTVRSTVREGLARAREGSRLHDTSVAAYMTPESQPHDPHVRPPNQDPTNNHHSDALRHRAPQSAGAHTSASAGRPEPIAAEPVAEEGQHADS